METSQPSCGAFVDHCRVGIHKHLIDQPCRKGRNMTYMYCSLDSLDEGSKLNIYGVVISFRYYNDARNPNDEQQYQHKLVVKLLDQSVCRYSDQYAGAVEVTLFSDRKRNLPVVSAVGDILRIHRIKGRTIDGRIMMEGKIGVSGCHAMVWPQTFEGDAEEYTHSFSSGNLFTLTDADKQMIDELRVFYADVRPTSDLNIRGKIAGILRGSYGDVIVHVIGRIRTTRGSVVLRVWDGSRHRNELPIRINEALEINQAESDFDEQLNWIAGPLAYDIFVYDEWKAVCQAVSSKDVVNIRNLHLSFNKTCSTFMMHRDTTGGAHQRGIDKLSPDDPRTIGLLSILQKLIDNAESADQPTNSSAHLDDQGQEAEAVAQPLNAAQNSTGHVRALPTQIGEAPSTSAAAKSARSGTAAGAVASPSIQKQTPLRSRRSTTAAADKMTAVAAPTTTSNEAPSPGVANLNDSADSLAAALDAATPPATPPGNSQRRNRSKRRVVVADSDDDEEEEVTASQEPQPVYRLRRIRIVLNRLGDQTTETPANSDRVNGTAATKRLTQSKRAKGKRA